jgi:hypothetical protein
LIGAPITDGTCELFPNERAESQRVGKGIRAPGTWNPKTNTFSLIEAPISRPSLEDRLTLTPLGAAGVILKLRELKIIDRTQCPVTHKESARFRWLLPRGKASHCNQLNHAPATIAPGGFSFGSLSAPRLNSALKDIPQLPQVAGLLRLTETNATHNKGITNMQKKTTKQPTKAPVDWEAVRVLAIELGAREAARRLGIKESTVLSRARRDKWNLPKRKGGVTLKNAAAITLQSKPGDVLIASHKELEGATKTGLMLTVAKAATHAAQKPCPTPRSFVTWPIHRAVSLDGMRRPVRRHLTKL